MLHCLRKLWTHTITKNSKIQMYGRIMHLNTKMKFTIFSILIGHSRVLNFLMLRHRTQDHVTADHFQVGKALFFVETIGPPAFGQEDTIKT